MNKVLVFMSTYNAEEFIETQIDSILAQEKVDVYLSIRDDGSKDATPKILKRYKMNHPNKIQLFLDDNVGVKGAGFQNIIKADKEGFDFYALADHDDYWMKDKLYRGVKAIEKYKKSEKPALYFSNLSVTDKDLNFRFYAYRKGDVSGNYYTCLPEFYASANTYVFNKSCLDMAIKARPKKTFYGDVWLYVLCAFLGFVYYDDKSRILFRRTGNNASGDRERGIKLWKMRLLKIKDIVSNETPMRHDMAEELLRKYYKQLDKEKIRVLKKIVYYPRSLKDKMSLIFDKKIRTQKLSRNICMWGRILINRF